MKKKKWLQLVVIALTLLVFFGYRAVEAMMDDGKAPEITFSGGMPEISVQDPEEALLQGVSARDNKDGDVTGSLVVESVKLTDKDGTISVTYAAFDQAGNVSKASREVRYTDYESPRFTLDSPLVFTTSGTDVLSVIGAQDTFDGDIRHRIRVNALDDMGSTQSGVYEIQVRVTNSLGDSVEIVLPVEVYPAGTYEAQLTLNEYLVYLPKGTVFSIYNYLDKFTLGKEEVSLRGGLPAHYTLSTQGTVDTMTPGVYTVSCTVTYTAVDEWNEANNRTYTAYSKLIVVVEG